MKTTVSFCAYPISLASRGFLGYEDDDHFSVPILARCYKWGAIILYDIITIIDFQYRNASYKTHFSWVLPVYINALAIQ